MPRASRVWALPFLTAPAPSERYARARWARHKRLTDLARQTLLRLARLLPGRPIVAVADRSYAQSASMVRAAASRSRALSLAKTCSIGLRSGE